MYTRWCAKICRNTQTTWEKMSTANAFTIDWLPLNCRRNCIGNKMNILDSGWKERSLFFFKNAQIIIFCNVIDNFFA